MGREPREDKQSFALIRQRAPRTSAAGRAEIRNCPFNGLKVWTGRTTNPSKAINGSTGSAESPVSLADPLLSILGLGKTSEPPGGRGRRRPGPDRSDGKTAQLSLTSRNPSAEPDQNQDIQSTLTRQSTLTKTSSPP